MRRVSFASVGTSSANPSDWLLRDQWLAGKDSLCLLRRAIAVIDFNHENDFIIKKERKLIFLFLVSNLSFVDIDSFCLDALYLFYITDMNVYFL